MFSVSVLSLQPSIAHANRVTATCNNTTADAATLNTAISNSSIGDEIFIQGPCLINAMITLKGDRSYSGYSRTGTVLQQATGSNLTAILVSDSFVNNTPATGDPIAIRHLTIHGTGSGSTDGIILRSWLSTIEDVYITAMGGNGIRETNLSANGTALTNTQVNGRIVGNYIEASGQNGIYIQDSGNSVTDTVLTDNWIGGAGVDGINMEDAAGWMIERNHIYSILPNNKIGQDALYANKAYGTTISDNYIEDFGNASTAGTWYGIETTIQGDVASTIAGNRIFCLTNEPNTQSTYVYLGISNVNYGTGDVSVTGNTIRGASTTRSTGLYYSKGSGAGLTVASTGNLVDAVHTARFVDTGVTLSAGL